MSNDEDEIVKIEHETDDNEYLNCNCKNEDKFISTDYCQECNEGFCRFCVQAHQRFQVAREHNIQKINYYCKCDTNTEEKIPASKYCEECSEAFCTDCVIAHGRLIITKKHIPKSIYQ